MAKTATFTPNMPDFDWVGKGTRRSSADVSITEVKGGTQIIFRNGTRDHFGQRVQLAVMKNRIYFRGNEDGFKLFNLNQKKPNGYLKLFEKTDICKKVSEFLGDYALRFDEFYELYYIEKKDIKPKAY